MASSRVVLSYDDVDSCSKQNDQRRRALYLKENILGIAYVVAVVVDSYDPSVSTCVRSWD